MDKIKVNFDSYVMPRSGSTLYRNVLREIFEREDGSDIICNHDCADNLERPIGLHRDFRDVLVSNWRIYHGEYENGEVVNQIDRTELDSMLKLVLRRIEMLDKFTKENPDALLIKYEDFWNDIDKLIDYVSMYLGITIPFELRTLAVSKNKLVDAKKISDSLGDDFDVIDKDTDLHAKHIYKGIPGGWKDIIPYDLHNYLNSRLEVQLKKYGYE